MKKVISIPLIVLILFSGIHVKFATHYCRGFVVDTKVSLTGELATCGMEGTSENHSSDVSFSRHCCDDITSDYAIDNNYTPSSTSLPKYFETSLQDFSESVDLSNISSEFLNSLYTNVEPPGALMLTSVDLCDICVFRI